MEWNRGEVDGRICIVYYRVKVGLLFDFFRMFLGYVFELEELRVLFSCGILGVISKFVIFVDILIGSFGENDMFGLWVF